MTVFRTAVYQPTFEGAPGVLLVDPPPAARTSGLLLGRYTFLIFETEYELRVVKAIAAPWTFGNESISDCSRDTIAWGCRLTNWSLSVENFAYLYKSPAEGWPFVVVFAWSTKAVDVAMRSDPLACSRQRYTIEAFETEAVMIDWTAEFVGRLARVGVEVSVRSAAALGRETGKA